MSIRKSDRIISVEHVSKYFGEKAVLNDVNLQVRKGEFVTILGPSGMAAVIAVSFLFFSPRETSALEKTSV